MAPHISICIPAYQRVDYLKRLLNSISIQTYKSFEVIISDDSPDESVQQVLKDYSELNIKYYKNEKPLGTPANWNFAISKAKGEWIKLMHDDDWFSSAESLAIFANHLNPKHKFIFSAYTNVFENIDQKNQPKFSSSIWRKKILHEPGVLLADNIIGPPSVTLIHSSIKEQYDERLKWRVDIEFYMRILQQEKSFFYINELLVNVGVSDSQVTQSCIYNPSVELPEGFILLEKHGINSLKNIWVYDAWWRLLRNMNITSEEKLQEFVSKEWPEIILKMVEDLSRILSSILKVGFLSKSFMFASYIKNKKGIK